MKEHLSHAIDWLSIKMTGVSILLAAFTWGGFIAFLSGAALCSTIIYNGIRIYREFKSIKPKK